MKKNALCFCLSDYEVPSSTGLVLTEMNNSLEMIIMGMLQNFRKFPLIFEELVFRFDSIIS